MNPSIDPFAILRSAAAEAPAGQVITPEAIVTPDSHPDLFAGSEPVNITAANEQAAATATPAAEAPAPLPTPAVAVSENVLESAILALESRLAVLETIAKRNGWNL